jgi:replicative DNA helicase
MRQREERKPEPVEVPYDTTNELFVIAAALLDPKSREDLCATVRPDHFLEEEHRAAWSAVMELQRRKLAYDPATLQQLSAGRVAPDFWEKTIAARGQLPGENLDYHLANLFWDRRRALLVQGPLASLIDALKRPQEAPEKVIALCRSVVTCMEGAGTSPYLVDGKGLVADAVADFRKRMEGEAVYPYGIPGLDCYEPGARNNRGEDIGGRARMLPGAVPGQITVVTAVSGGGKSTVAAHVALGQARQKKRVLYGAWEPSSRDCLQLLGMLSLGMSLTDATEGRIEEPDVVDLKERMEAIAEWVTFMDNPFWRAVEERSSNLHNLDLVHRYIADSGCDVFIADLWDRCLVSEKPEDELNALKRQQAMARETNVHCILLAQQRLKDIETRSDKRPTREGIKGSSAWVDVADTIIAPHRPALFKDVSDNKLELFILKQRRGPWPIGVEFDWDPEFGSIRGGRSIRYEHAVEAGGGELGDFVAPPRTSGGKKPWRR